MTDLLINDGFTLTNETKEQLCQGQLQLVANKEATSGTSPMKIYVSGTRVLVKHDHGSLTIAFKIDYLFKQYNECETLLNSFTTEDVRVNSQKQFSRKETSQIHSLLLLLSSVHHNFVKWKINTSISQPKTKDKSFIAHTPFGQRRWLNTSRKSQIRERKSGSGKPQFTQFYTWKTLYQELQSQGKCLKMHKTELLEILNDHLTCTEAEQMVKYQQRKDIFQPNLTINVFGETGQTFFIVITTPRRVQTVRVKMFELQPHQ